MASPKLSLNLLISRDVSDRTFHIFRYETKVKYEFINTKKVLAGRLDKELDIHRPMVYMQIMDRDELRKWRQRNGYSQGQLAKVLSVDVMTISRWERGVREIPSFLHLALSYLELRGKEIQPTEKRKRERRK